MRNLFWTLAFCSLIFLPDDKTFGQQRAGFFVNIDNSELSGSISLTFDNTTFTVDVATGASCPDGHLHDWDAVVEFLFRLSEAGVNFRRLPPAGGPNSSPPTSFLILSGGQGAPLFGGLSESYDINQPMVIDHVALDNLNKTFIDVTDSSPCGSQTGAIGGQVFCNGAFLTNVVPGEDDKSTRDRILQALQNKGYDAFGVGNTGIVVRNANLYCYSNDPSRLVSSTGTPISVPTLRYYGLIALALILAGTAFWMFRRRRVSVSKRQPEGWPLASPQEL